MALEQGTQSSLGEAESRTSGFQAIADRGGRGAQVAGAVAADNWTAHVRAIASELDGIKDKFDTLDTSVDALTTAIGTLDTSLDAAFATQDTSIDAINTTLGAIDTTLTDWLAAAYGCIYNSSTSATTISDTTSYFDVAGTTTLVGGGSNFDMPANGRLRYTGSATKTFAVQVSASMTSASNNQVLYLVLGVNGTEDTNTVVQRKTSTGADVGAASISGLISLAQNDYVTLMIRNSTTASNATIEAMNMLAFALT
jgi:hypothetical protein